MPPQPRSQGPKKKPNVKVPGKPDGSDDGDRRKLLLIGGAVILVAILGAGAYAAFGGGGGGGTSGSDAIKQLEAAGCTVQTIKALPAGDHSVLTPSGNSKKWNSSPPTSGPHYQVPAIWGAYTTPLYPAQVVHNLEHGGIFIQYGPKVPQATVDQLKTFYDSHLNATLLAPLPNLGSKIAMGVWTTPENSPNSGTAYLAKCTSFDDAAYAAFFKAYQFKGPERFAPSTLTPGS
jgi:hypothetical protein